MYNLNEAYTPITTDTILAKISEYNIWKHYCRHFEELGKSFISEFYDDRRASCRIFITSNNVLLYKDFGTGECLNCWQYIQKKYSCNLAEAANIVANDFNIAKTDIKVEPKVIVANDNINLLKKVKKSIIEIISQPWTIIDYNYWSQYEIPLELLEKYDVFSCKTVYLHKGDTTITYHYSNNNPIYAYRFEHEGQYSYKIYFPLADKGYKWLFSGGSSENIEGFDQLPHIGNILILTKSLKDCMCYNLMGLPAISLQGEANKLDSNLVARLLKRFDEIIVNYDNDEQGHISTEKLVEEYGFDYFYIDEYKDLSDYIKERDLADAKVMIDGKIKKERSTKTLIGE